MSDPKHLTDEGADATDLERELLSAAQGVGLTTAEKKAIWAGVALQALPNVAGGATAPGEVTPGAAANAGAGLAPWLKGLLLIAGLGGTAIFGMRHVQRQGLAAPSEASSAGVVPVPARASNAAPSDSPSAAAGATSNAVAKAPSAPNTPSAGVSFALGKSALREESVAVLQIRSTLREGDASGALRLLEQARQRFPHGALSQEREALSIEALAKTGARDAAARKADAFLRAHPKSPYAADVQSFTRN